MLNKILISIILLLTITSSVLYLQLQSTQKSLKISEQSVVALTHELKLSKEASEKAESLKEKHEEIISELFLDQDTTQQQFDDLLGKFNALKGCKQPHKVDKRVDNIEDNINDNINDETNDSVDFSEHSRLFSEAACLAGDIASCSTTTPTK